MAAEAFKKHEIVPDVIFNAPNEVAKVVFSNGAEV
jgi:hypothetical protein